jgi:hypothetical protein
MALVSADVRDRERARLEAKVDELVLAEARADRAAVEALGTGVEGLAAGVRWQAQTTQKYGSLVSRAPVQSLFTDLATRRSPLLAAAESTLTARIQAASSSGEAAGTTATYVGVPSDRSDPAGARILGAAQARQAQLAQAERAEAQQRAVEERQAASPCAQAPTDDRDVPNEPSSQDMCRAIESTLSGADENLEEMRSACSEYRAANDPILAMMCLGGSLVDTGGQPLMSIRAFRKIACVPADGRPGFSCDYILQTQTGMAQMRAFMDRFGTEMINARFVRMTGGRWLYVRNP